MFTFCLKSLHGVGCSQATPTPPMISVLRLIALSCLHTRLRWYSVEQSLKLLVPIIIIVLFLYRTSDWTINERIEEKKDWTMYGKMLQFGRKHAESCQCGVVLWSEKVTPTNIVILQLIKLLSQTYSPPSNVPFSVNYIIFLLHNIQQTALLFLNFVIGVNWQVNHHYCILSEYINH